MKPSITIVSPYSKPTGGIELLHQLAHTVSLLGHDSSILYHPFDAKRDELIPQYEKYNAKVTDYLTANKNSDIIFLPETLTHLAHRLGYRRVILWWMSVDNYINSASPAYAMKNRLNYFRYIRRASEFERLKANLYQSQYAKEFLNAKKVVANVYRLSDYLNPDFLTMSKRVDLRLKEDIVVYNPAKGLARLKLLMRDSPNIRFIPIQNMQRSEVIGLLSKAKIYLDLGNHPGKDRIPREAAVLGCVVLSNRRGASMNSVDIPIPEIYKVDDSGSAFTGQASDIIESIFCNYGQHYDALASYRQMIYNEPNTFLEDTQKLIKLLTI